MISLNGTYSAQIHGETRTLTIASSVNGVLTGSFDSTIQGKKATFPLAGIAQRAPFNNDAVYFALQGHAMAHDPNHSPPTLAAVNAIVGIANFPSGGPAPTAITITMSWAEDKAGYSETTGAWDTVDGTKPIVMHRQ